jgi:hypothetical protein
VPRVSGTRADLGDLALLIWWPIVLCVDAAARLAEGARRVRPGERSGR